ncbi:hypothetical protein NDU88_005277 [Pleurodeles waltl]|uniref:Uncharacterized protein n=1 Tax=Pleurodeles waltl TaxID=8319 RepID=A0AAV7QEB5_PLEWA|nr:hypothetical protein NDU88_005277 [Pleurodeles waltl]
MVSAPTGQGRFEEEEETFSTQESDSEEIDPEETPKTVSDRLSTPKKGELVSKSSDPGRDTGTQQSRARDSGSKKIRHRDSGTEMGQHREGTTPKVKKVSSEPKKAAEKVSLPKHPASEPKKSSYSEEQGLSSQMKTHRFEQELETIEPDHTQRRLFIKKDTGKISTLPPIKMKRKLAFQDKDKQPHAKVAKQVTPPPSPHHSPPPSPVATPPMMQSPTHTGMSQDDPDAWDLYDAPVSDNSPECYPARPSPPEDSTGYAQVVSRAAAFHSVSLHSEPIEDDFLF